VLVWQCGSLRRTGAARVAGVGGPAPALETAPFIGALDALTAAAEVSYRGSVPGVGAVDVKVTNFGQLIGSVTEDGDTIQLLLAGGKLYVKPSAPGLRGVTSRQEATALKGKWLTGSEVQSLLSSIPAQFVPPAQLAIRLASALGSAPALKGRAEIAGVPVLGVDTPLGVLYVSANTPYRIVSLSPKISPSASPASSGATALTAYAGPGGDNISFPVDPSSDGIANTDEQLEDEVQQLAADSVNLDLNFTVEGSGSINCSDPDDALSFLRVIADGYAAAGGCWPCWHWVRQQLWTRHDLDAEQILGGLPTWKHDYRPARLGYRGQPIPNIADEVPLSIHGMAYVYPAVPAVGQLVEAFLTALRTAAVMQRGITPEPTRPAELKVTVETSPGRSTWPPGQS
jgi:hypothetical protein